ncbi:MAG: GNAT family N-acetyltransferase [Symploca sp. SIO2C1]|nr:GNAT family N-acetyltransferase [Symploca sp. SIO2C1]
MVNLQVRPIQNQQELEEMYYQRWLVLRAPLGMVQGTEQDKYDSSAFHVVAVCDQRTIVGSARLRELSPEIGSIAYVCVLPEFRHQGIGTKLIQKLIEKAQAKQLKSIRLKSRMTALDFYQRLGFSTNGEPFDFLNIPHIFMSLNLLPSSEKSGD